VAERPPHMKDTIRIMTWNVHGTFNLNPHFNLDGVRAIIEKNGRPTGARRPDR
jgi:hypothetical protein